MTGNEDSWKTNGVRIIPGDSLDKNTPQSPGMTRAAAINYARVGAQKIWAGTVRIEPNAKTGPHHHGSVESVIYVVRAGAPACVGANVWNTPRRLGRETSFTFRPACRIRK